MKKRAPFLTALCIGIMIVELIIIAIGIEHVLSLKESVQNQMTGNDLLIDGMSVIESISEKSSINDFTYYAIKSTDAGERYLEENDAGNDLFDDSYREEEGFYRNIFIKHGSGFMVAVISVGWVSDGKEEISHYQQIFEIQ